MKLPIILKLCFAVENSEMFNYDTGYASTSIELDAFTNESTNLKKYAENMIESVAKDLGVKISDVTIISEKEYIDETEDDEESEEE